MTRPVPFGRALAAVPPGRDASVTLVRCPAAGGRRAGEAVG
jgi:hypothetical protein